jgi:choline-sulfatase
MASHCFSAPIASRKVLLLASIFPLILTGHVGNGPQRPVNVLIITLDTTRADALPAYGGTNLETPALDRLAREGVVFEQATSSVPLTLPAHCSLFTGLLPTHHAVRDNADPALSDAQTTLSEILRGGGFDTAAFVGSAVVGNERGLRQGFDMYSDPHAPDSSARARRPANVVVDQAIEWIAHRDSRFFAWIHLYDAHAPYAPPEPYRTMYEDVPYLGAIAFVDAQIARVLTALDWRALLDRTLIVVVGDHGESLGDHGEDAHGIFLYQSTVRVPLVVRLPGFSPRRVEDVTRLIDVMPTVLDALGLPSPSMDGVSLLPLMRNEASHLDLEAYSESLYPGRFGWSALRSLRAGRFKFVSAPRPELYDLQVDPRELHNVYDDRRELAALMSARLDDLASESPPRESDPLRTLSASARERLMALGYIASVPVLPAAAPPQSLADPKDRIALYNAMVQARNRGGARDGSSFR